MKNDYLTLYRARIGNFVTAWKQYQLHKIGFAVVFVVALVGLAAIACIAGPAVGKRLDSVAAAPVEPQPPALDLAGLVEDDYFYRPEQANGFTRELNGETVSVQTTLDPDMQQYLLKLFRRHRPYVAAAVVLDARNGAVLAMANYRGDDAEDGLLPDPQKNLCISAGFPAASLIKIVTAAAVVEKKQFSADNTLPVSGRNYTLYKHQLGLKRARFRSRPVSLKNAFSKSINPFFGTLGIQYLKAEEFAEVAEALLFNVPLDFDLPLRPSTTFTPADDFESAELASGFNTRATISPLHAALLSAAPANNGKIMRPFLIDRVVSATGSELYRSSRSVLAEPLSPRSIDELRELMQATVRSGTARKQFRSFRRLHAARNWTVGGKTGAINLPRTSRRCEWFSGFAENGQEGLALACVIVHRELRTKRPSFFAAQLLKKHIRTKAKATRMAKADKKGGTS